MCKCGQVSDAEVFMCMVFTEHMKNYVIHHTVKHDVYVIHHTVYNYEDVAILQYMIEHVE